MNSFFDDLAREIANGTSRRGMLRRMGLGFTGFVLSSIGMKRASAAVTCGTCQACDLDTNTCGLACTPPSAGQTLCTQASKDGSYLRLAYYLTTHGFTQMGSSTQIQLYQTGQLLGAALTTNYTGSSASGQTAVIQYVVSSSNTIAPVAIVYKNGTAVYLLGVSASGRIVETILTQNSSSSSGSQPLLQPTPIRSNSSQIIPNAINCGTLVDYLCGTGGGLACFGAGLLICPETGPGVIPCGLAVTVICGLLGIYGCDKTKEVVCGCGPNNQNCNGTCCGPCMDCLNNQCIPNITCPDVCCNNVCCDPGLICTNNQCVSPNSACVGATCSTFVPCSTNTDCVCVTVSEGGGLCVPGSTACAGLVGCPAGSCPAGSLCAIDTCCGDPVCVPISLTCPPEASSVRAATLSGPTIGHR